MHAGGLEQGGERLSGPFGAVERDPVYQLRVPPSSLATRRIFSVWALNSSSGGPVLEKISNLQDRGGRAGAGRFSGFGGAAKVSPKPAMG